MLVFVKALLVAVVCSGAVCSARRLQYNDPREDTIIRQNVDPWRPDGYKFAFQTSFGISRSEIGYLKTTPNGRQVIVTEGEFSYFGTDRKLYRVNYIADENGYQEFLGKVPLTREGLLPSTVYEDGSNDFLFPDDELNIVFKTTSTSTSTSTYNPTLTSTTGPTAAAAAATPPVPSSTAPTIIGSATPDVTVPTVGSNDTTILAEGLDDRYGLPPGVIGSLLGG